MILGSLALERDSFFRSLFLTFSCCFFHLAVQGQGLTGTITESFSHHPIPDATIRISFSDDDEFQCTTNAHGEFLWPSTKAGRAIIEITAEGFDPFFVTDILLDGYSTQQLSYTLEKSPFNLEGITVVSTQSKSVSLVRTITSDDILRIAGNFEDPVRIAQSQPGIVLLNDQTNHYSARGQAPLFNSWYLEGLKIVNPNHTSNAGTLSDLPTQYGGGVNMFSAQTLGNTDIHIGVNPLSVNTNSGGAINMHLHETAKPEWRAKAGFLGIEFGGGTAMGVNSVLDFNLRYSFTGILTGLGADFDGEKINYYDGVISFRNEGAKHKLKLFAWAGRSTNNFTPVDSLEDRETYKDFFSIDYGNNIIGVGGRYNLALSPSVYFNSGLAYSENKSTYHKEMVGDSFPEHDFNRDYVTGITSLFSTLDIQHSTKLQTSVGADFTLKNYRLSNTLDTIKFNNASIRGYLNSSLRLSPKWSLDLGAELRYNADSVEWVPGYRGQINWRASQQNTLFAGIRHGSSDPFYSFANTLTYVSMVSKTIEAGWIYHQNKHQFKLNIYYQRMKNLEAYSISEQSSSYEYLADYPNGQLAGLFIRNDNGFSEHTGVEAQWDYKSNNGWAVNINQSVFQSVRGIKNIERQTGRYNGEFASHFSVSKEYLKKDGERNKFWNFAFRGIYNGGLREPDFNTQTNLSPYYKYPVSYANKLPNYFRLDAGITRTITRAKVRWRYSLDIQNVFGITNVAYHYYDPYLNEVVPQNQLGLIPVLSVQASW